MQLFLCPRSEEDKGVWLDNYKFLATYKLMDTVSAVQQCHHLHGNVYVAVVTHFVGNLYYVCTLYM